MLLTGCTVFRQLASEGLAMGIGEGLGYTAEGLAPITRDIGKPLLGGAVAGAWLGAVAGAQLGIGGTLVGAVGGGLIGTGGGGAGWGPLPGR